jgi:hypothetical protein
MGLCRARLTPRRRELDFDAVTVEGEEPESGRRLPRCRISGHAPWLLTLDRSSHKLFEQAPSNLDTRRLPQILAMAEVQAVSWFRRHIRDSSAAGTSLRGADGNRGPSTGTRLLTRVENCYHHIRMAEGI